MEIPTGPEEPVTTTDTQSAVTDEPTPSPTSPPSTTEDETPTTDSTTTTATTTTTTTTTTTDSTSTATTTGTASWSKPTPPTTPTEDKREDRITNVSFINTVSAGDGSGYSDFDVQVNANTVMKNVDPKGDVEGEPYIIIKVEDTFVARASVTFEQNGTFAIEVPSAALEQFDAKTLTVRVSLLDEDSHSDDLYDTWSGTIEYSPS